MKKAIHLKFQKKKKKKKEKKKGMLYLKAPPFKKRGA
jgi:hypothetical protein